MNHKISIIIPYRLGGEEIASMSLFSKLNYPKEYFEIILVQGNMPSIQRNKGVEQASGDIIYFIDNDTRIRKDNLIMINNIFMDDKIGVYGGPNLTPEDNSVLQKSFGSILGNFFGTMKVSARYKQKGIIRETDDTELILCNLAVRKSIFIDINGFNTELYPNEENELIFRIKKLGYKIVYDPDFVVYRSRRKTIGKFIKQMLGYGRGRMEETFVNPGSFGINFIIPALIIPFGILLLIIDLRIIIYGFIIYLLLNIFVSTGIAIKQRNLKMLFICPLLFFITHSMYSFGMIWGIVKKIFFHENAIQTKYIIDHYKKFGDPL